MFNNKRHHAGDFKRRIFASGEKEMLPSPEFKAELLQRMREKIRTQYPQTHKTGENSPSSKWRKYIRVRIPLAAAASLLIVFGGLWAFFGRTSIASADFGEMLRQVRQALSVYFTASIQAPGETEESVHVYYSNIGQFRQVFPDGKVHIVNSIIKKYLVLTPTEKRAVFRSFGSQPACYTEPLDTLRQAADSAGKYIRNEEIQGQKVSVYQLLCEKGSMTVWVDQEKQLPVRIQRNLPSNDGAEIVCTLDNFQWDIPISDSQFALDVPYEYVLENTEQEASESDLIFLLRFIAKQNNDSFPKNLQADIVIKMIYQKNDIAPMQTTEKGSFISKSDRKTKEIGRRCFKGLAFIKALKQAGNWYYMGEGVQLNDRESIVCYWSLPDSKTFRAIYGDLTVKELPAEDRENILRECEKICK